MKILSVKQINKVDELTIANEPVASIDLMERAALACERKLVKLLDRIDKIFVISGKGNNGGDGMAIARLLFERGFHVKLLVIHYSQNFSRDAKTNYDLFKTKFPAEIIDVKTLSDLKENISKNPVIIDALFGSGLNKPVVGLAAEVIDHVNSVSSKTISIDVPSGLFADSSSVNNKSIIEASLVLTLQFPKLAFFMPENGKYVNDFDVVDIGLNAPAIDEQATNNYFITQENISSLIKKRNKFDHKGTFGHGLLIAGSKGKGGAAIISAKACLRSGTGLLTVHSVDSVISALTSVLPEAMSSEDPSHDNISSLPAEIEKYDAVAFGPGIGTHEDSQTTLKNLVQNYTGKLVIDADGLNILSENKTWLSFMIPSTILTPHVKEFERLAGNSGDGFERLKLLREFSIKYSCIVILKGAYTSIAMPDGNVFFNSSGNPGLAKGGSGDALTGIILGLLSRGYNPPKAVLIGTYIHGLAADICAKKMSMESILISDVIDQLPKAFRKLEKFK
ncbi:MAG: NAD(P)H-hydrate dehydratase [Bacteroidia bacterium]